MSCSSRSHVVRRLRGRGQACVVAIQNTQVQLVALENFGHAWPAADAPYGEPSAYNGSAEIGLFFASLPPRPR